MMSREYKIFLDRLSQKGRNLNDFGRAYLTETIYIEKAYSGVSMMFLKTSQVLNINIEEFFTNLNMSDMETCYKLFRADIIKSVKLRENRFGFEPEVTAKIARIKKIRIYEVGISYYGRTYEEGKKIGPKDGFRAIYCILKYGLFKAN